MQAEKVLETKWLLKLNGDYSSEDGSDDADYKLNDGVSALAGTTLLASSGQFSHKSRLAERSSAECELPLTLATRAINSSTIL